MTFHYTDPDHDQLIIEPTSRYGRPAISLRNTRHDGQGAAAVHIPVNRVEELITGIRDTTRQATTHTTTKPTGPACGNNPNHPLTDGDRQAVAEFRAYLADRGALRDRIAEALEQADYRPDMRRGDLADAIMPVLPPAADRGAILREAYEIAYAEGMRLNALEAEIGVGPYRGALAVAHLLRKAISDAQQDDKARQDRAQPS